MKNEIYFKDEKLEHFYDVYVKYSNNEFKSPYRSTIPLLLLFKSDIWNNFDLITNTDNESIKYIFEFETPVLRGIGRASCTDLLIEYQEICIAVEAKRTEPPYETVKKWLSDSKNKKLVLEGWLEIIGNKIKKTIDANLVNDLPYQMIHRVASACSRKKGVIHVIYLGFDLNKTKKDYYIKSIESFSKLLNNSIAIQLICFKIIKSEMQIVLETNWDNGKRDLSNEILKEFENNSLMEFTQE